MKLRRVFLAILCGGIIFSCVQTRPLAEAPKKDVSVVIKGDIVSTLGPLFFGHNYYEWVPSWGRKVHGTASNIIPLHIKFLRFGGMDFERPDRISREILNNFFDYCRKIDAEPLLMLPLLSKRDTRARVTRALEIIDTAIDLYPALHYAFIGTEPDLARYNSTVSPAYRSDYDMKSAYSLENYISDFLAVSSAVKEKYPQLKILGPELGMKFIDREMASRMPSFNAAVEDGVASKESDWLTPFVAACKDNVDIVSIHSYPFYPSASCTYENAKNNYDVLMMGLAAVQKIIRENAGGKKLPLAITETNLISAAPEKGSFDASPGTFNAALWMADVFGIVSSRNDIFSLMPFSICERWNTSYLDPETYKFKPVAWVYELYSSFTKRYCISNLKNGDVRIYAYKDDGGAVSVFLVNWDKTSGYKVDFSFENVLSGAKLSYTIQPYSVTCLTISADKKNKKAYIYSSAEASSGSGFIEREW
jgi:hypothetical protein